MDYRINPDWQNLPLSDHKDWKRLAFGEFAHSVNERVEPSQGGDEIYVGLEHLDPQDLHIRRWGKGSDVIGTKLRFRKGDLIFGRRAYQRKLAVAEFDGICSAHAMVVRAKPDVVLPEFLPFLMMSDRFMNRAVEISVGSLSPTINWTPSSWRSSPSRRSTSSAALRKSCGRWMRSAAGGTRYVKRYFVQSERFLQTLWEAAYYAAESSCRLVSLRTS
jgi:hypothetical protein